MIYFTNSKGERLPEDINKVANERYNGGESMLNLEKEIRLWDAFIFEHTDEEHDIWVDVYKGRYQPFYDFHDQAKQARKAEIIAEIEKLQNELKEL